MDKAIIRNHNSRVKPEDTVFFLGDFCFKNSKGGKDGEGTTNKAEHYLKQLNGRFVFIRGNHDSNNSLKSIIEYCVINFGGKDIHLCHNPADFNPYMKLNLCGHVHGLWKTKKDKGSTIVNVGIDVWNFKPISINEIMGRIK